MNYIFIHDLWINFQFIIHSYSGWHHSWSTLSSLSAPPPPLNILSHIISEVHSVCSVPPHSLWTMNYFLIHYSVNCYKFPKCTFAGSMSVRDHMGPFFASFLSPCGARTTGYFVPMTPLGSGCPSWFLLSWYCWRKTWSRNTSAPFCRTDCVICPYLPFPHRHPLNSRLRIPCPLHLNLNYLTT